MSPRSDREKSVEVLGQDERAVALDGVAGAFHSDHFGRGLAPQELLDIGVVHLPFEVFVARSVQFGQIQVFLELESFMVTCADNQIAEKLVVVQPGFFFVLWKLAKNNLGFLSKSLTNKGHPNPIPTNFPNWA